MMTVLRFILRIALLPVQAVLTLLVLAIDFLSGWAILAFRIIGALSVIEKKKPSERVKRTTYPEKKSFRDDIRDAIDQILKEGSAKDFDELLYKLEDAGYEIKRGKHISLKGKEQKRFIRLRSLGDGYTDEDLKKILAGEMEHAFFDNEKTEKQPKTYQRKKEDHEFDLLIDIQKKLAQGKGKYYVRFAKNFNTKQVAKAVLYLKQHDIRSYDDLEKKVKTATERFMKISASIKEKEKRLAEIQIYPKANYINMYSTFVALFVLEKEPLDMIEPRMSYTRIFNNYK